MATSRFKALTFDCYGTLIDWESGILAALRPWVGAQRADITDDQLLEAFGQSEARWEALAPTARYPDILDIVQLEIARAFDLTVDRHERNLLSGSIGDWPAFDDSQAALIALGKRFKLVVLSNIDRASFALSQTRLGAAFDAVVTAEDVQSYKPALAHFQRGLEVVKTQWGIAPEQVLHVAQSLYHDHVPARQLGLATAWVDRRRNKPGWGATPAPPEEITPDIVVANMAELAAAV